MKLHSHYDIQTIETLISNLAKRHITGYYVPSKEAALEKALALLQPGETISWGGSMTLGEIGLIPALSERQCYQLLDRSQVPPDEVASLYKSAFNADTYFMSTNAITLDGKLINTDGTGNRVAALIYGPKQVIIVAGMNKIVLDEKAGFDRIAHTAGPRNAVRLNRETPCRFTGHCEDCLSPDCICMQTVITRNSRPDGRIKVILVDENLGY